MFTGVPGQGRGRCFTFSLTLPSGDTESQEFGLHVPPRGRNNTPRPQPGTLGLAAGSWRRVVPGEEGKGTGRALHGHRHPARTPGRSPRESEGERSSEMVQAPVPAKQCAQTSHVSKRPRPAATGGGVGWAALLFYSNYLHGVE